MTPTRALISTAWLRVLVRPGLQAMRSPDLKLVQQQIRASFADSLDVDAALQPNFPSDPRWDYFMGHGAKDKVIALEPHSAKSDEVSRVIRKKKNALDQVRPHLSPRRRVERWFWVASGSVQFPDLDKTSKRLAQENIIFVGRELQEKHIRDL